VQSKAEPHEQAGRLRPCWRAGLAGCFAQTAIAWLLLVAMIQVSNAALDEGHMFEGDGPEYHPRPPALFTWDWWGDAGLLFGRAALIFLPGAILLVLVMAVAEREDEKQLSAWLLAGCASAAPLAVYLIASAAFGAAPPPSPIANLLLLLGPCVLGAFGALAAWRVRRAGAGR
jgi:hypothetical protein